MEAASKKRGRPSFARETIAQFKSLHLITAKTNRGAQNSVYCHRAIGALGLMPDAPAEQQLPMIADWPAADRHVRGAVKYGALAELGRIAERFGADTALSLARSVNDAIARGAICSAKDAELRLRKARMILLDEAREADAEAG